MRWLFLEILKTNYMSPLKTTNVPPYYIVVIAFLFVLFTGCSNDDDFASSALIASAGDSQTVKPQMLVTLDGSNSTGSDGFTYSWTYAGEVAESEIDFQNTTSPNPTFTPPLSTVYTFTLTTKLGDQTSSDQVTVVASGGIEIGGTLTSDLALIDIEPDAGIPDYIVTSDLIVPAGITLSVADENVMVYFEPETGIHAVDGGKLTNMLEGNEEGLNILFSGDDNDSWKGIWIENSIIDLNNATIENAGMQQFEGLSEGASLILSGAQTNLMSLDENTIDNSFSYSVMVPDDIGGEGRFTANKLSYKNPVKAHITFLNYYFSNYPNVYPDEYDYSIFVPSGLGQMDVVENGFRFSDGKYYIDGDFWAGSSLSFNRATVFVKEGAGILAEANFNCRGDTDNPNLITGLDGAHWKGIAAIGEFNQFAISKSTIQNAGYGIIEFGDFEAEAEASIYSTSTIGTIEDNIISDGGGFGYYNAEIDNRFDAVAVLNNEFNNLQKGGIRTDVASVGRMFAGVDIVNHFSLDEGVPAVLVQVDGSPSYTWPGLGSGDFYLIDAEIITHPQDGFSLSEGAHLKFKSGRSYVYKPGAGGAPVPFRFVGTAENPVILEGVIDAPGSWGGILFKTEAYGYMDVRHCIIKNGGEFVLPGATEKANFSYFNNGFDSNLIKFNNCTVSGSAGYGIIVEEGSFDPEFDAPGKNNEFYDNTLGDILVQ